MRKKDYAYTKKQQLIEKQTTCNWEHFAESENQDFNQIRSRNGIWSTTKSRKCRFFLFLLAIIKENSKIGEVHWSTNNTENCSVKTSHKNQKITPSKNRREKPIEHRKAQNIRMLDPSVLWKLFVFVKFCYTQWVNRKNGLRIFTICSEFSSRKTLTAQRGYYKCFKCKQKKLNIGKKSINLIMPFRFAKNFRKQYVICWNLGVFH